MNCRIELHLGDCLEVMATLPDGCADAIITDPPFGTTNCKWDSVIPFAPMWEQLKRLIKPKGAIVLFASQPFTSALVMSNPSMFKYDWTWRKPKGTGHLNAKRMPMRDKEDILVFSNGTCVYYPQFSEGKPYKDKAGKDHSSSTSMTDNYGSYANYREDNEGKRYPKQILEFGVVERGSLHPTQKPVALMEYLIKTYTNEGETVLDFTCGSCSTGIGCLNTNRNFIGIERDAEYFEIAQRRIEEAENPAQLAMTVAV